MKETTCTREELISLIDKLLSMIDDKSTLYRLYSHVNRAFVTDGRGY